MQHIQCFRLRLGDGRDIFAAREIKKAGEAAARVLDYDLFWGGW